MKKYLAMAAAALALVACDKNNDDLGFDNTKDTPITILSAGVADLSTRAINNGVLEGAFATLGLYVNGTDSKYTADHEYYSYAANWEFTKEDSKDNTQMLFNGTSFDWIVYSPYWFYLGPDKYFLYDATTFSVCTDGGYNDAPFTYGDVATVSGSCYDLLWGKGTSNSATFSPELSHVLTMLTVNITKLGTEIEDEVTIEEVIIGGTVPTGTLNLTGATKAAEVVTIPADNTVEATDIVAFELETPNYIDNDTSKGTYNASYEALIIPQTATIKLTIKLSNDRVFSTTLTEQDFQSGYHYNITLQVGQDKVVLEGIAAAPWGEPVEGGQLETE